VVTISHGHHHSFSSFLSAAREVAVLRLLHLSLYFMSQKRQSFLCSLSHASLERSPWCGSLDHMADAVNMIGRRPLIDDHTNMPNVRVPAKQPRDTDEKWGLAISQHQEQCPQSPHEVANTLTIVMGLCRHDIPLWGRVNVLPRYQLPCHLEKRRNESK
jgi:hypothetical protein